MYISDTNKCYKVVLQPDESFQGWDWSDSQELCQQGAGINPEIASILSSADQGKAIYIIINN